MDETELSYILNELGEERENYFRAVAPPIIQTSNFAFETVNDVRESLHDEYSTWLYSRGLNPTVEILRKKLAALDKAEDCLVFNSGAAAIFAAVLANVKSGGHIVSVKEPYTWARKMFTEILPRFNVETSFVDGTQTENFKNATKQNTILYYLETPRSWTFDLQDLKAIVQLAKENNILTICDNSYCTPIYQKPVEYGIDLVLQSASKYIGGHSDTVAGVLSGSKKIIERIFNSEYMTIGSGIQPFNAWLLIRGLRTLPARLDRISHTTKKVLEFLKTQSRIEKIFFPLDEDFAQHKLAIQQMKGACGLLSFVLKTENLSTIETFCNSLRHILIAVSWGGHESLIIPKCAGMAANEFNANISEHKLIRLYVGLEDVHYIISDLENAFLAIASLE